MFNRDYIAPFADCLWGYIEQACYLCLALEMVDRCLFFHVCSKARLDLLVKVCLNGLSKWENEMPDWNLQDYPDPLFDNLYDDDPAEVME